MIVLYSYVNVTCIDSLDWEYPSVLSIEFNEVSKENPTFISVADFYTLYPGFIGKETSCQKYNDRNMNVSLHMEDETKLTHLCKMYIIIKKYDLYLHIL
jgi:hypothetical protein